MIDQLKTKKRDVVGWFEPMVTAANKAWKALTLKRASVTDPLDEAITVLSAATPRLPSRSAPGPTPNAGNSNARPKSGSGHACRPRPMRGRKRPQMRAPPPPDPRLRLSQML